jgi:hypothetical protein
VERTNHSVALLVERQHQISEGPKEQAFDRLQDALPHELLQDVGERCALSEFENVSIGADADGFAVTVVATGEQNLDLAPTLTAFEVERS